MDSSSMSSPWNRRESETPIVSVMGASSWPTLSEITNAPPSNNRTSSNSLTSLGDIPSSSSTSVSVSEGIATTASGSAPIQAGRVSHDPTPAQSRQRSSRRNETSASSLQATAQAIFGESPSHNTGQSQRNGKGNANHHHHQSHQNGNHHQNHNRRNQGNSNWTYQMNFNGNAQSSQQRGGGAAFVRHAPPPPPPHMQPIHQYMMAAQPIQAFVPYPYVPYYHHMPPPPPPPHYIAHVPPPAPVFYQVPDLPLNEKLQTQIHYYFSDPNLIKDSYLRGLMDDQGFVPIRDIAGFNRVRGLTSSIQQIVEALQDSPFVTVQGEKIRKRHDWQKWLLPKVSTIPEASSSGPSGAVATELGNLSLGSSSQLQQPNNGVSDGQQQSSGVDHEDSV